MPSDDLAHRSAWWVWREGDLLFLEANERDAVHASRRGGSQADANGRRSAEQNFLTKREGLLKSTLRMHLHPGDGSRVSRLDGGVLLCRADGGLRIPDVLLDRGKRTHGSGSALLDQLADHRLGGSRDAAERDPPREDLDAMVRRADKLYQRLRGCRRKGLFRRIEGGNEASHETPLCLELWLMALVLLVVIYGLRKKLKLVRHRSNRSVPTELLTHGTTRFCKFSRKDTCHVLAILLGDLAIRNRGC